MRHKGTVIQKGMGQAPNKGEVPHVRLQGSNGVKTGEQRQAAREADGDRDPHQGADPRRQKDSQKR